jgi:hypothetical protein
MVFVIVLFFVLIGGGWLLGKGVGQALFEEKKEKYTFNSTHVHHHYHEHKNISIIDDSTKKKIFELKESEEHKK